MSWFSKVKTLEDLKKEYKKLAMQYHPDRPGGDTAKMQQINGEYDRLFPAYQAIHNRTAATPLPGNGGADPERVLYAKWLEGRQLPP